MRRLEPLSVHQAMLVILVADRADNHQRVPTIREISEHIGLTTSNGHRHLQIARAKGWIEGLNMTLLAYPKAIRDLRAEITAMLAGRQVANVHVIPSEARHKCQCRVCGRRWQEKTAHA